MQEALYMGGVKRRTEALYYYREHGEWPAWAKEEMEAERMAQCDVQKDPEVIKFEQTHERFLKTIGMLDAPYSMPTAKCEALKLAAQHLPDKTRCDINASRLHKKEYLEACWVAADDPLNEPAFDEVWHYGRKSSKLRVKRMKRLRGELEFLATLGAFASFFVIVGGCGAWGFYAEHADYWSNFWYGIAGGLFGILVWTVLMFFGMKALGKAWPAYSEG